MIRAWLFGCFLDYTLYVDIASVLTKFYGHCVGWMAMGV